MRNTYLVCYDICQDKRLAKVHRTMRTRAELSSCRYLLNDIINHDEDQVLFVDLGPSEGRGDRVITALGKAYSPFDSPCIIVTAREER